MKFCIFPSTPLFCQTLKRPSEHRPQDALHPQSVGATLGPLEHGRGRSWLFGLLLIAFAVMAYLPATRNAFIWDDDYHLTANPCIIGPLGLKDIWTSAHARICPLVQTTFWVEYHLWGLNPLPYHLVNILMHAAAALVLWRVLLRLKVPGAWLGAALWMLHPVQVESVAWITELKNTQSGLFFLLSILFFCKSRQAEQDYAPKNRSGFYYSLTLTFGALALASKSSTVVLPLVLGLCAWWIEKGWRWRRNLLQLVPLLLLSILTGVVTMWTQKLEGAIDVEYARSLGERIAVAGKVGWFYAGKLLWPHPLIFVYPRWQIDATSLAAYWPTVAAGVTLVVFWWKREQWARSAFFASAYFFAALLPVLGLLDHYFLRYSFVGDHFQYLASMGPLALAGAGISIGLGAFKPQQRWLLPVLCSLLLLTLGTLTWRQCAMYQNDEVLWSTTLQRNPASWMAHNNFYVELAQRPDRQAEAISHLEAALRLKPNYAQAHYNLGLALASIPARLPEAIAEYRAALRIKPDYVEAHNNLGVALTSIPGCLPEALAEYAAALRLRPDFAEVHYNLGVALERIPGRLPEAMAEYAVALRLKPEHAKAHYHLGLALASLPGRQSDAIAEYRAALRIKPDYADAHCDLGAVLASLPGRLPEALAEYTAALRLKPDYAEAHNNMGAALANLPGRLPEAMKEYLAALRIKPDYAEAHYNLGVALARLPGRRPEAMAEYEAALRLQPSLAAARQRLEQLRAIQP